MEKTRTRISWEGHACTVLIYWKRSIWKRDFLILWVLVVLEGLRPRGELFRKAKMFPQGKEEARKGYVSFCWVSVVDIRQLGSGAGGDSSKFLSIYGLHRFISWRGGDIIISLNLRDTDSYVLNSYLAVPDDSDRRRESRLFLNSEFGFSGIHFIVCKLPKEI